MNNKSKYFSFDPNWGFEFHETEEEAKTYAQENLDSERSNAFEGWSDDVVNICWGELKQRVAISYEVTTDDGELEADYELKNIGD